MTMLLCTIASGQKKGANEKSFVFVHQHGGYDVTKKPPIVQSAQFSAPNAEKRMKEHCLYREMSLNRS